MQQTVKIIEKKELREIIRKDSEIIFGDIIIH